MFKRNKEKAPNPDKMPLGKFFAWKSRDISLAAVTVIVAGYLMLFATDTLGLSSALVGTLLMASRIFDGVTDLIAGFIVDNTQTKFGKGRPYEVFIVLIWIFTIALFFASPEWSTPVKATWIFVAYTLTFSLCQTFLNANQTPYMIRAFKGNRNVITKVSSFGGILSMVGSIAVSMTFPRTLAKLALGGGNVWPRLILTFAIPLLLIGIMRVIFVKEEMEFEGAKSEKVHVKDIVLLLKTNKYAWYLAAVMGLYNLVVGFGAGSYYFTYIVGDIGRFGFVGMFSILTLPVMIFFPKLMRKYSVSTLFKTGAVLAMLGYSTVFFSSYTNSFAMLMIGILMTTLIALPVSYLLVLCVMDLATFNEYNNMPRMEALTGNITGFASKAMSGIGTGLTGILLGASGFVSGAGGDISAQPASALFMIRSLYSLIPLGCMVLIFIFAHFYGKLEKQIPAMKEELANRQVAQEVNNQ